MTEYLLNQGADIEAKDQGMCRCGSYKSVTASWPLPGFGSLKIAIHPIKPHATPLHLAIYSETLSTVKLLLRHGADIRQAWDGSGGRRTALHLAVHVSNRPLLDYLHENKLASIDEYNDSGAIALHMAFLDQSSPDEFVDRLLEAGADINAPFIPFGLGANTWTLFALARASHDRKAALKLLRAGADPEFIIWVACPGCDVE